MKTSNTRNRLAGILSILAAAAQAGDLYVAPDGGGTGPFTSWAAAAGDIQTAITAANSGDTIWISNGVYALSAELAVDKPLTLVGVPASAPPTIDGQGVVRCLKATAAVTLEHLRLVNGKGDNGGGLSMGDGTLRDCVVSNGVAATYGGGLYMTGSGTVERCAFIMNTARYGGGLSANDSTFLRMDDCTFATNQATTRGGGVYLLNALETTLTGSRILGNTAVNDNGGGMVVIGPASGTANRVTDTIFRANFSGGSGGGLWAYGAGETYTFERCTFTNNTVVNTGGGLTLQCAALVKDCLITDNRQEHLEVNAARGGGGASVSTGGRLVNCRIENNVGNYSGGGVFMNGVDALVRNCLIRDNESLGPSYGGGGIRTRYPTTNTVENCTIVENYAYVEGGGVYVASDTDRLINCIIYSNTCNQSQYRNCHVETGKTPAFTNCCLTPALPAANDDFATGIITASPLFADADYRLGRLSPCIDAGVNNLSWMAGALDLDGRGRINPETGKVDLGCYEFYPVGTLLLIR